MLDPSAKHGMNLLRLNGPHGAVASISVLANLEVVEEHGGCCWNREPIRARDRWKTGNKANGVRP